MEGEDLSAFERAVAVEPTGAGRYRAVIDSAWNGPIAPNGGVLAAIMVRAAEAELGAAAPPARTVSVHFLDAPSCGPAEVAVEVLRRGKRVAVCDVRLRESDRLIAQMTLLCSSPRAQELDLAERPPEAPGFRAVEPLADAATPDAPLFRRVELRPLFGPAPFSAGTETLTGGWLALRDDPAALDAARLCALCDLWWPPIFGRMTSLAAIPTLQLTVYLRSTEQPVRGPVLARFETRTVQESHLEERGELWSSDGRLLAESVQLALVLPL